MFWGSRFPLHCACLILDCFQVKDLEHYNFEIEAGWAPLISRICHLYCSNGLTNIVTTKSGELSDSSMSGGSGYQCLNDVGLKFWIFCFVNFGGRFLGVRKVGLMT